MLVGRVFRWCVSLACNRETTSADPVLSCSYDLRSWQVCFVREKVGCYHFVLKFYNCISKSLPYFIPISIKYVLEKQSQPGHLVVDIL